MKRKLPKSMAKSELKIHKAKLYGKRLLRNKVRRQTLRQKLRLANAEVQEAVKKARQEESAKWRQVVTMERQMADKARSKATEHMKEVGRLRRELKKTAAEKDEPKQDGATKRLEARLDAVKKGVKNIEDKLTDKREEVARLKQQLADARVYEKELASSERKRTELEKRWNWLMANTRTREERERLEARGATQPKRSHYPDN
jgi:predicted  nucleic acid-binding Zn-ribbon protein